MTPDPSASEFLVALVTTPSADAARSLVRTLVERRLIACGTVLPGAVSIYRWEGAVEEQAEAVAILKTTREQWPALAAAVPALHNYSVPELIALPLAAGLVPYLAWVQGQTTPSEAS
jgi:periplasmic divalent cation tolerance protein